MKIYTSVLFFCLFLGVLNSSKIEAQTIPISKSIAIRMTSAWDDVEENEDGEVYVDSSDLELTTDGSKKQTVGIRFSQVPLPKDITIKSAYIQFTTDEKSVDECLLQIQTHDVAHSQAFDKSNFNVSSRKRSSEKVEWAPFAWDEVDSATVFQQSPDLKTLLQNQLNRADWEAGNAISFIITGTGKRTAYSFDNDPEKAPYLKVEYTFNSANILAEGVIFNELMPKNQSILDENEQADDWFELYNKNDFPVFVGGLYLSDDRSNLGKFQIQFPLTIPAKQHALFWADENGKQGPFHTNFKLKSEGESIYLSQYLNNELLLLDSIQFDTIPEDISYGRKEDGHEEWLLLGEATPGTSNKNIPYLNPPRFSHESGYYDQTILVKLSSTEPDARIFYTIDGTTPSPNSLEYNAGIMVNETQVIKAIAMKEGYTNSEVQQAFYLFNNPYGLPVIHISAKPEHLWNDTIGIYTKGTNGAYHHNYPDPANWFQDWERPGTVTMLNTQGKAIFTQRSGIAIGGNASRGLVQKTWKIHFRNRYGDGEIKSQLFKSRDTQKFKHLKLRNGGQDFWELMLRDGLNHSIIINKLDVDVMAYQPVSVYLNGEYWGMYGMRESFNDDYIDAYHPIKKDQIDLLKVWGGNAEVDEGSNVPYKNAYNYLKNNDVSQDVHYDSIANSIEISSFLDYNIAQIYYANYDWPANNVKVWRDQRGGKFRWLFFDTEASTNFHKWSGGKNTGPDFNSLVFMTSATSTKWPNNKNSTIWLRKLLENQRIKQEFAQRTCTYISAVFNPAIVNQLVDSVTYSIDMEIDRHIEKWTKEYPQLGEGMTCDTTRLNWEENVQAYKRFFEDRPAFMMEHMKSYFNTQNTYLLQFNYTAETKGKVTVNQNNYSIPYDYSAEYFSDYPLQIKAIPDSGYHFVHWLETMDTTSTLQFKSQKHAVLTPIFSQSIITSNEEPIAANNTLFKAFPNPTLGHDITLHINHLKQGEEFSISITSITGQIILKQKYRAAHSHETVVIPTKTIETGTYLVRLQSSTKDQTEKVVVQE